MPKLINSFGISTPQTNGWEALRLRTLIKLTYFWVLDPRPGFRKVDIAFIIYLL